MYDEYRAKIHIKNTQPIKVENLVSFFCALQKEYNATVGKEYQKHIENSKPELAISEVQYGSQIYELIVVSSLVLYPDVIQYTIVDFFNYFQKLLGTFKDSKLDNLNSSRKECTTAKNFTDIFADDNKLSIDIAVLKNKKPIKEVKIANDEGCTIREKAITRLQLLQAQKVNVFDDKQLYFYQTRNVSSSSAGDRAIIPSIADKPHKIVFVDDTLKQKLLDADKNIYRNLYKVSGSVEYTGDKVKLYNIDKIEYLRGREE